jgi:hypothetical protein
MIKKKEIMIIVLGLTIFGILLFTLTPTIINHDGIFNTGLDKYILNKLAW